MSTSAIDVFSPAQGLYLPSLAALLAARDRNAIPFWLSLPIGFDTVDATALYTVPSELAELQIHRVFWEVTQTFIGGTASAIGVSSDAAGYTTKGDLLGGAAGDVAATLVSTGRKYKGGTLGAAFASNGIVTLPTGASLRFDRIVSAFTAGAGFVHVQGFARAA